jgi:hypothetical protein
MGLLELIRTADGNTGIALVRVRDTYGQFQRTHTARDAQAVVDSVKQAAHALDQEAEVLRTVRTKMTEIGVEAQAAIADLESRISPDRSGVRLPSLAPGSLPPPEAFPPGYYPDPGELGQMGRTYSQGELRRFPRLSVGDTTVTPKDQQDLTYRRAARRHGKF